MFRILVILVLLLLSVPSTYGAQVELRGVYMELTDNLNYGVLPVVPDGDWRRLCRELKQLGVNAIFPNVVSPAGAIYPSNVVLQLPAYKRQGMDESRNYLDNIITAAHEEELEVHAWTIEWHNAPKNTDPDRLMRDAAGKTTNTLCPSQDGNRDLMRRMILELVKVYDIDGIQYDYMRFPSEKYCYCRHCREKFEKAVGSPVANWPAEVISGGRWEKKYLDYLYGTLNSFVRELYPLIKKAKPDMVVSAAVWAREKDSQVPGVRQDWGNWVRAGVLDFIAPMNYGNDWIISHYNDFAQNEAKQVAGKMPLVFGLGAYADTAQGVVNAVKISRGLKTNGFIIYTLTQKTYREHLPALYQKVWSEPAGVPRFGRAE
ncbi:MAG TPA: hypothetical protein DEP50_07990 [Acinetobacter lwoffii]|nr:hypothetical protein [Acinetobacter lwoffii]